MEEFIFLFFPMEMLKTMTFGKAAKLLWIGILAVILLMLAFSLLDSLLSGLGVGSTRSGIHFWESKVSSSLRGDGDYSYAGSSSENAYVDSNIAPTTPSREMEVRSTDVSIHSRDVEQECPTILTLTRQMEGARVMNTRIAREYCSVTVQVPREKEGEYLKALEVYDIDRVTASTSNIYTSYTQTSDRIEELKKQLAENDARISETKTAYDELLAAVDGRRIDAEAIDAISKTIRNKAELIENFSTKKQNIITQIDSLLKQKADYEEQVKYSQIAVSMQKRVIIDWKEIGELWRSDFQNLVSTLQDTVRNMTVNLATFLLRALSVVTYIVVIGSLVLFGGRIGWSMGKKILGIHSS